MGPFALIAFAVPLWGWLIFDAVRKQRRWEAMGLAALLAVIVSVLYADAMGQPRWVTNVLVSLGFVLQASLAWKHFRRQRQAVKDAFPPSRS